MGSAPTYDELHGSNNWAGLLDPLDPSLRRLLVNYGDLITATQKAFNNEESSKYCGYSNYGKKSFFKGTMVPWAESKYDVTSFFYATSKIDWFFSLFVHGMSREDSEYESNWMGYVAVSNDEYSKSIGCREICVVWRGTVRQYEWMEDILGAMPVSTDSLFPGSTNSTGSGVFSKDLLPVIFKPKVMEGWLTIYNTSDANSPFVTSTAKEQLETQIKALLLKYKDEKVSITCTGHSLGASVAVLSAFHIAAAVVTPDINVSAMVTGCPQVGDKNFKQVAEQLPNLKVLRVKNDPDPVPFWPSKLLTKSGLIVPSALEVYVDVGVELLIDSRTSPYLKDGTEPNANGPPNYHNSEGSYYHTLCGWNGKNGEFDLNLLKKGVGFVNLFSELLKDEYEIPVYWWVEKNKGMVLDDNGDWVLPQIDRADHDLLPVNE
ncbi:alpha/Beta hydrolase fold protein [Artemisia annua]|uniref:Phospholipase A1 n=1 Tax=Artemisia annua TaxID=35608 RepID=A0A2U1M043_ARTAN|nr:alpha/Beta hydrolase fold protein [Artemisia annua]